MSSDVAISVQGLSKHYQIYDTPRDRLKQFVLPRLRHMFRLPPRHYFREFKALDNISFEVKKGETVGIIGRNGSGKSTLLQLICGTLTPTSGTVQTTGRIAALLELGSGFNPEFTGRENIYMYASVLGLTKEEVRDRFDDIVAFADIGDFIEQPVKTYSSGMVVRLAFAVIAHVDADILVIDEALAVGDAFFVQKCMRFLRKFMQTGTILFVSHDTSAVISLCQRSIWLAGGQMKFEGSPKEAAERYLAALFEANQGASAVPAPSVQVVEQPAVAGPRPQRDMRQDFLNASNLRNDIEVFEFKEDSSHFGKGGATITSLQLLDLDGNALTWVVGGEEVQLLIHCVANQALFSPIVGFFVKDRLGQTLFGDNTYLTYADRPLHVEAGQTLETIFRFQMPVLLPGDYSIAVAIAEGTQQDHVQHHWMHDALILKSHSTSASTGLVGIPMTDIRMTTL